MRTLALIVGWVWLGLVWLAGCWTSVTHDRIAWLVFWILFPPGAWLIEVITSVVLVFVDGMTGVALVTLVFLCGWIPLLIWGEA